VGRSIPCTFCKQPSLFKPADGVHVCENCAARIGGLAQDAVGVENIWSLTEPEPRTDAKLPSARPSKGEFEETFPSFKEGVSNAISPDDAASHADLAVAYAEMGLRADALREAGIALTITSRSPVTQVALRVLFGSALMTPSGLRALQRRLRK
jgi:hypothetical protein